MWYNRYKMAANGAPNRDEAIQRIGIEEYINCVLVEKGARREECDYIFV